MGLLTWLVGLFCLGAPICDADEGVEHPPKLRRVFIPYHQATKLVPENYRSIELVELEAWYARFTEQQPSRCDLRLADYVVRYDQESSSLICDDARLIADPSTQEERWHELGPVNVAVGHSWGVTGENEPRLATQGETLMGKFGSPKELNWIWSKLGTRQADQSLVFDLQLPLAQRAVLWLQTPADHQVEVRQGMLIREAPPLDRAAFPFPKEQSRSWHRIDFGGTTEVQIRIHAAAENQTAATAVMRGGMAQYDLTKQGLNWTTEFRFEVGNRTGLSGIDLPSFRLHGKGRLVDCRVNGKRAVWEEQREPNSIGITLGSDAPTGEGLQVVTFSGVAQSPADGEQTLPWIEPARIRLAIGSPDMRVSVRVADHWMIQPMDDTQSALGSRWRMEEKGVDSQRCQWIGSMSADKSVVSDKSEGERENSMRDPPPRFRLLPKKVAVTGSALTGVLIEPEQQRLRGIWSALLQLPPRPQVLNLHYGEGWEIDSVVGEQGPLSHTTTEDRVLRLWVEPSDFAGDDPLRVKILATREFSDDSSTTKVFPGDWVIHVDDSRLDEAAYLLPPTDREVQIDSQGRRRQVASLEDLKIAAELVGEVPESALRFNGPGGPPSLELRRRQAELDVEILTRVSVASPKTLRWQARAKCLPRGGQVDEIRVRIHGAIPQQGIAFWMEGSPGESPLSIASTPVLGDGFSDWTLRLGAPKSKEFFVTATLNDWNAEGTLPILTVPRATKHRGEIELLDGIRPKGSVPYPRLLPVNPQKKKTSVIGYGADGLLKLEVVAPGLSESDRSSASVLSDTGIGSALARRGKADPFVLWNWRNHQLLLGDGGVRVELSGKFSGTGILEIPLPTGLRFVPPERDQSNPAVVNLADRLTLRLDDSSTDTFAVTLAGRLQSIAPIHFFHPIRILPEVTIVSQQVTVGTRADAWMVPLTFFGSSSYLYVRRSVAIVTTFCLGIGLLALSLWPVRNWSMALMAVAAWSVSFCGFLASSPLRESALLVAFAIAVGPLANSLWSDYRSRVLQPARPLLSRRVVKTRSAGSNSLSFVLLFLILSAVTFGSLSADPRTGHNVHEVLIPIDDEGNLHGTIVYVPQELYTMVRRTKVMQSQGPVLPKILASDYQFGLSRSSDSAVAAQSRVEATWQIDVELPQRPLFLPIDPRTIDTLQWSPSGSRRTWRQGVREGVSGVILQPPGQGIFKLQGKLIPIIDQEGDVVTWSLPIPQSHHSKLNVAYDPVPGVPDGIQSSGSQVHDPQTRQFRVELGGKALLSLHKRIAAATPLVIDQRVEPRWWIRAGVDRWSAEMEYDRPPTNPGTVMTIEYPSLPVSTNAQWKLLKTESLEGGRHRLHFEPNSAVPGPLRLLWSIPFAGESERASLSSSDRIPANGKSVRLNLPVVRADDGVLPQRALLAIEATQERIEVVPDSADAEKLPIEAFSVWKGFRSDLGSVFRVDANPVPPLNYKHTFREREIVEVQHRLVISPRGDHAVSAEFRAATGQMPILFEIPQYVWIDRVELDGDVVEQGISVVDGKNLMMLVPRTSTFEHRVTLEGRVNRQLDFVPPRIRIRDLPVRQELYEILKPPQAVVKVHQTESLEKIERQGDPLSVLLDSVMCWRVTEDEFPRLSVPAEGAAGTMAPQVLPESRMVTTVRRAEGNWQQETVCRLADEEGPNELLSILIPQAWSERVEVNVPLWLLERPEQGYRRLNVLIPKKSGIASATEGNQAFTIRIQSMYSGEARVEAPLLRLEGYRVAEHRLVLPGRLTTQSIQWQPIGMRRIDPVELEEVAELPPEPWILEPEGEGRNLAASLVPLDGMEQQVARSTLCESWLFNSQTGQRHLLIAWDFIPGSLTQVRIDVPEGLEPLSVNSAGAPARHVWDQGERSLKLDLNLHQLGQVIEVFFATDSKWKNQLPELANYPADRSLLNLLSDVQTNWQPASTPKWRMERSLDEVREESAREVIRSAFDVLPDRTRGEADDWLAAWLPRFGRVGQELGKLGPLRERLPPEASAALASWDPIALSNALQEKTVAFTRNAHWQTLGTFSAVGQPPTVPLLKPPRDLWSPPLAWLWLVMGGLAVYLVGYHLAQRRPIWFSVFPLACVGITLTSISAQLGGLVCLMAFTLSWWRMRGIEES